MSHMSQESAMTQVSRGDPELSYLTFDVGMLETFHKSGPSELTLLLAAVQTVQVYKMSFQCARTSLFWESTDPRCISLSVISRQRHSAAQIP